MRYTEDIRIYLTARPNKVVRIEQLQHVIPGGRLHEKQVQNAMSRIRREDNVRFQCEERGKAWRYVPNPKLEDMIGPVTVSIKDRPVVVPGLDPATRRGRSSDGKIPVADGPNVRWVDPPETMRDKAVAEVTERTTFRYMGFSDVNGALLLKASNGKAYVAREL